MMHPDDYDQLMRICKCVAVVWVLVLSFRMGRTVFMMMESGQW
jgi:hypothetical protein